MSDWFDQDEIVAVGNPWHGRFQGGVLNLPNGATRSVTPGPRNTALAALVITGFRFHYPSAGDCYLVAIPGLPVPVTSSADATAGMTWTNYALLSGCEHLFYGVELGHQRWVYIDDDAAPWLVSMPLSGRTGSLVFRRLGVLFGDTTADISVSFAAPVNFGSVYKMLITDLCARGRKALITVINVISGVLYETSYSFPVSISGVPGVDLVVAVAADSSVPGSNPFDMGSTVSTGASGISFAANRLSPEGWFFADETLRIIYAGWESSETETTITAGDGTPIGTRWVLSGSLKVVCGSDSHTVALSAEKESYHYPAELYGPVPPTFARITVAGLVFSNDGTMFSVAPRIVRRSNKVYEAILIDGAGYGSGLAGSNTDGEHYSIALITPSGITPTGALVSSNPATRCFSYQPKTGNLLLSESDDVCWM